MNNETKPTQEPVAVGSDSNEGLGGMSRDERALLYTVGICNRLVEQGLLEGGKYRLASHGLDLFAKMESEGFKPTKDEIERSMMILQIDAT